MKTKHKRIWMGVLWCYSGFISGWYILHLLYGDRIWWLGLLNAMAPWLFAPLLLLLPLTLRTWNARFYGPLLAPALLFLLLYGPLFAPVHSPAQASSATTLTVLSFNIWAGSRTEKTAQVIADNGWPDIVALQELTPQMADVLIEMAGHHYPYHHFDITPYHYGLGVFSRFPLTVLDSSQFADSALRLQVVKVHAGDTDDQSFTLYNLHLSFGEVLYDLQHGAVVRNKIAVGYQTRQALTQMLVADVQKRIGPVIVAGDFNSTPLSDVYQLMTKHLTDAHRAAGWGFGYTYPTHTNDISEMRFLPRLLRIDLIFFSAEFSALRCWVSQTYGKSDHRPVVATLQWFP